MPFDQSPITLKSIAALSFLPLQYLVYTPPLPAHSTHLSSMKVPQRTPLPAHRSFPPLPSHPIHPSPPNPIPSPPLPIPIHPIPLPSPPIPSPLLPSHPHPHPLPSPPLPTTILKIDPAHQLYLIREYSHHIQATRLPGSPSQKARLVAGALVCTMRLWGYGELEKWGSRDGGM